MKYTVGQRVRLQSLRFPEAEPLEGTVDIVSETNRAIAVGFREVVAIRNTGGFAVTDILPLLLDVDSDDSDLAEDLWGGAWDIEVLP